MTSKKQSDSGLSNPALYVVLALFATIPLGLLGAILGYVDDDTSLFTGLASGISIAIALLVVMGIGMFGWDRAKKEASEGKLRPYMLGGLIAAIAISAWMALSYGNPSCDEYDPDPRGGCISYADDGFEVTNEWLWGEFWNKLPVTLIICLLIAYIAHSSAERNRPKHFKSEKDKFTVGIFPETISVDLNEDGNQYKYSPYNEITYIVYVTTYEDFLQNQPKAFEVLEASHVQVVSAATGHKIDKDEYSDGEKQGSSYIYGSYQIKKGLVYYHLTMERYGKMYSFSMYIQTHANEEAAQTDKIFFEFVDSIRFI